MQQQVEQQVNSFIKGDVADSKGKTYAEYKQLSTTEAANSVKLFTEQAFRDSLKNRVEEIRIATQAGKEYKNGAWVAKESDAKRASAYLSTSDQKAKMALDIQLGNGDVPKMVEESMRPVYTELTRIAYDFDHGWTNSTELNSLEKRGAQLWYESQTNLLTKGTDRIVTNDSKIRTYTGIAPLFEKLGWLNDGYEVKKFEKLMCEYLKVKNFT
jgi:hypothetical protein